MSNFIHAMKAATVLLLEGKKDEAEAILHAYFHGSDGTVNAAQDGGSGQPPPPDPA
jgi:hypothetical protein